MSDLKQMFEDRENAIREETNKILEQIPNVVQGAIEFLGFDPVISNKNLKWEEISLLGEDEYFEDGTIFLVGVVAYEPGETFTLPSGESVEVSEQTAEYFQRIVRIGVPYGLAVSGSKEDILEFLRRSTMELEEDLSEKENKTDFDLRELTEEQRRSLAMFTKISEDKD